MEVVRPFWRTWPFGVVIVGMGLGAAWAGVRWREHRARVRSERAGVEALTSERARIARAMHDHLGPRIATLAMEGGGTEEAHARAREALRELNEVIWAVNPEHDTLEGLADFVSNFASRYLAAARLALNLDIEPGLPAVDLPVQVRGELAAMFKEALRNAVQHARASRVLVGLRWEQEEVRLSIADDGGGFAWPMPEAVRARHVARKAVDGGLAGVLGFQARMSALGGECRIESAPGQGTRIEFRWPARRL